MQHTIDLRMAADRLWFVLMVVWLIAAIGRRKTVRRQSHGTRLWQSGILLLGGWLLFWRNTGVAWLDFTVMPRTNIVQWTGFAITLAGIAFALWARLTLGTNWSGVVALKEGQNLVRRGPYRVLRHPIYTGILAGLAGTAVTRGSVHALMALPVCAFAFWLKSLTEEQFMVDQFGEEYLQYRRHVRALVPFIL